MSKPKAEIFKLVDLPDYEYPINVACPTCYKPLQSLKRVDGRCDQCRRSKAVLPVNYVRVSKKKTDEDEESEKASKRYNREDD